MDPDESFSDASGAVDQAEPGEYGWEEPSGVRRTLYLPAELSRMLAEAAQAQGVTVNVLIVGFIIEGLQRLGYGQEVGEQG
jgi:predicted HicB family RNase H-like nuclease